jgi:hypothetical protein
MGGNITFPLRVIYGKALLSSVDKYIDVDRYGFPAYESGRGGDALAWRHKKEETP